MIKLACELIFKLSGWKFVNNIPDEVRSFIFLGAPHTSNADFIPAMAISRMMKRNAKFVIKSEWLKFPLNLILKPMGAYGLDRSKLQESRQNNTELMAGLFNDFKELVLTIAPEGTRRRTEHWKTGFYYVALKAKVPIVLGYADFDKKEAGLGLIIYPSDFETDMKKIMQFYKDVKGRRPQNFVIDSRYSG
jgi:hypothetical protein